MSKNMINPVNAKSIEQLDTACSLALTAYKSKRNDADAKATDLIAAENVMKSTVNDYNARVLASQYAGFRAASSPIVALFAAGTWDKRKPMPTSICIARRCAFSRSSRRNGKGTMNGTPKLVTPIRKMKCLRFAGIMAAHAVRWARMKARTGCSARAASLRSFAVPSRWKNTRNHNAAKPFRLTMGRAAPGPKRERVADSYKNRTKEVSMMTSYFAGCHNLDAAKAHHPDLHPEEGDEIMQQINAQYDALIARLSRVAPDGFTEATAEEARAAQDVAEAFRAAVYAIINLEGLNIELCGAWLWVSGDTLRHRDALKAAGYRWAHKKQMWYWRPEEAACRHSRRGTTMADIRMKYGSERIRCDAAGFRPALVD